MIRRSLTAIALAAATFAPVASHAFPLSGNANTPTQAKVKMVKLTLKNQTNAPMSLLIEDKEITIAANSNYALAAPEGTHVYGMDKAVKVLVTRDLNGSVCSFH